MRRNWLVILAAILASACASDEIDPPLTCEPGPVFRSTIETCELVIDGNGGPKAAVLWTIEAEDQTWWRSYELASDGGLYVFADDNLTASVARLGPSGELEWSRSLVFDAEVPDDSTSVRIQAGAAGPDGIDVVVQRRSKPGYQKQYDASVLTHLSEAGECSSPIALAFGGEQHGQIGNMVREPDRLVLTGTHTTTGYSRGFIQRRSLGGELILETEIDDRFYNDVATPRVQVGGPESYVVRYTGYAPVGLYSSYSAGQLFDESLTSVSKPGGRYISDAFGRLYIVSSNATPGDEWAQPPKEPQPPTLYHVTRSQTPDAPAGETLDLEVPQPLCGWPTVTIFDETLLVLTCKVPDSPPLLLGYDGTGPPDWTATIDCADVDLSLNLGQFTQDRRLWVSEGSSADKHIVSVEL